MPYRSAEIVQATIRPYIQDLSAWVLQTRISPLRGRDEQVSELLHVLLRTPQRRNNPILVGDPGPDRFAIIAEMVRRMALGFAPTGLISRQVLTLDMDAVVRGGSSPDLISERLSAIFEAVRDLEGHPILFVDHIHRLVGGELDRFPIDISPLLKTMLGEHELQMIGATKLSEYQTFIERDPALNLRFQHVLMQEWASTACHDPRRP